jgi:hypothetical protein
MVVPALVSDDARTNGDSPPIIGGADRALARPREALNRAA